MKPVLIFIFLLFSVCITTTGQSQKEEDAAVIDVIERLFEGMRKADSAMVHSVFFKEVELYTALTDKAGNPVLHKGSLQAFLDAVGSPHDVVWDEPIWDTEVRIDGNLAQVWTRYAFYAGDKFSHCGVDAFHLFKSAEGWKIFHLTDTRTWDNCEVPAEIKKKHNDKP